MADHFKITTKGFDKLSRALTQTVIVVDPLLSKELRIAAEPVRQSAIQRAANWGPTGQQATARGIKIRRKGLEIRVEQSQGTTTNMHPEYAGVQMKYFFLPALEEHTDDVVRGVETVIDGLLLKAAF